MARRGRSEEQIIAALRQAEARRRISSRRAAAGPTITGATLDPGATVDAYLRQADEAIGGATGHLTVEDIARTIPGKWSIAEILEHLTLTFTTNVGALGKALASGESKSAKPTLLQWFSRVLVIDLGYFPRAKAPEAVVPHGMIGAERSRESIHAALVTLDQTLERAAAHFGEWTPLLKHAFFAGLTVPQWRKFHWRHTLHHMKQVRERS